MKLYFWVLLVVCVIGAFWCGKRIAAEQCRADVVQKLHNAQSIYFKQCEVINAKVNNTTVRDIRDILRQKYTIAD